MKAMIAGLDAAQRAAVKLTGSFGEVLLGPGADDVFPAPSGDDPRTLLLADGTSPVMERSRMLLPVHR
jgi:hypothetical protein